MKVFSLSDVAATIDHAVLKPNQTELDIHIHADICMKYSVASMCVRPCDIRLASKLLHGSPVKVSCVLSFPHGHDTTSSKVFQAQQAILDGVDEIDMVMNIGQFLSGQYDYVTEDITGVVQEAHAADVLVKVIQESCFLTMEQIELACKISMEAGADFVKTSTGFGSSSATPEIIETMINTVKGRIGVKASGGIRSWDQAVGYLQQGATRLGIGSTQDILEGYTATEDY